MSLAIPLPENDGSLKADAGGPYESFEGKPIVFNASASQGPGGVALQYRWDFDDDGVWDTAFSDYPTVTHTWSDDHIGTSTVEVQTKSGGVPSAIEIIGDLDGFSGVNNEEQRAQSFVAEFGLLTQVSVDASLGENRVPDAPLTLAIRSDLNGPDLASAQMDGAGMPGHMVENWVVFDIPDIALDVGLTYYAVLYSYPTNAPYELHVTLDAYPNGTAWGKGPGGGWAASPSADLRMVISGFGERASATDEASVTVHNLPPTLDNLPTTLTVVEGNLASLSSTAIDPGTDDLVLTWSWEMGPTETSTFPNDGTYPFTISDSSAHAYGDDGTYLVNLTVEDDDGGMVAKEIAVTVANAAPALSLQVVPSGDEGGTLTFQVRAIDPGSDDLTYTWWGQCNGWSAVPIFYPNDPVIAPDPDPSPDLNPRNVTDIQSVVCGDDGVLQWNVTVEDDDGGVTMLDGIFQVNNLPPSLAVPPPSLVQTDEGVIVTLEATASDPGSDDLVLTWNWEYGPTETRTLYNDAVGPDPPNSPDGIFPFTVSDSSTHTYGDDCHCSVSLTIEDDDGGTLTYVTIIEVFNLPPKVHVDVKAYGKGDLTLRVAGEKWHDVVLTLYEGGVPIANASTVRVPGSPNQQTVTIHDIEISALSDDLSAYVVYTPLDDSINGQLLGATPAWLIFQNEEGAEVILHHTFNVNHEATWTWSLENLRSILVGLPIIFEATASDDGSDDLSFNWSWGDGTPDVSTAYYSDGFGPDPFPSPDVNPSTATDVVKHAFLSVGSYTVSLTVNDDDGGEATIVLEVML
jgi:hypothetical protein